MKKTLLTLALFGMLPLFAQGPRYQLTITNLTSGQVLTPILVASHEKGVKLFTPGGGAPVELEMLAEGGSTAAMMALLDAMPEVGDVTDTGGVLLPGQTVMVEVAAGRRYQYVSLAAMLIPTNDAFVALNGVAGPVRERNRKGPGGRARSVTVYASAWDAGTEPNDESCASIPGPPGVCGGEGFNPDRMGAEGFIHIHSGIHGGGDLSVAERDWNNPVARVEIRRVR